MVVGILIDDAHLFEPSRLPRGFCLNFSSIYCVMHPPVGLYNLAIRRMSVVLPQPFSPRKTVLPPFGISSDISLRMPLSLTENFIFLSVNSGD